MKKHAVAIPIYRFPLMPEEEVSFALVRRVLSEHTQYIVCPQSLVIPGEFLNGEQVLRFPDACFTYPDGYNRMLMSKFFYKAFEQFQYILIYQLDCLVFRDELSMWCEKGYDYIGSPWYENYIYSYQEKSKWWIGNGGFSLRKVSTALDVLSKKIKTADRYQLPLSSRAQANRHKRIFWCTYRFVKSLFGLWTVEDELNSYGESEDRFWSLDAGKFLKEYKVAPVKEGMLFGFEQYPEKCFQENGGVIPFGCHAWAKHNRGFIESMLKNAGISLK